MKKIKHFRLMIHTSRFVWLIIFTQLIIQDAIAQKTSTNLIASTYFGGASIELYLMEHDEFGMLQHPNGDIYICGPTQSTNIPITQNAFQPSHAGGDDDSFIARLDPDLGHLVACTYLGGSGQDIATSMVVDMNGNICVVGHTSSGDFPVTPDAYDTSYIPTSLDQFDAFISILTPQLDEMIASSFLGGSYPEWYNLIRVALDTNGNIIVAGGTISGDFPVTPNAYSTQGGTDTGPDIFISKLSSDLSQLKASTYFGGHALEQMYDILVNPKNEICICGITGSHDYPVTSGAYDTTFNGDGDGYIAILGNDLDTLIASTFFGGIEIEFANAMTLDNEGNFYVCGETESYDFPNTSGAYDTTFNFGFYDGYIIKIDSNLANLQASTYLGSSEWDNCRDIIYDDISDEVFVTGLAGASSFPATTNAYDTSFNGQSDIFISKLDKELEKLNASTFIGGQNFDFGLEILFSDNNNIIVGGNTLSSDFPTTPGAFNEERNGSYDVSISLIDKGLSGITVNINEFYGTGKNDNAGLLCYPNPFSNQTTISFSIKEKTIVKLNIYSIDGKYIETLTDGQLLAGTHRFQWDGKNSSRLEVTPGIYVLTLCTDYISTAISVIKSLER